MEKDPLFDTDITLAIETSGRIGSVALARGQTLLAVSKFSGFMKHGAELFPHLEQLLSEFKLCPGDISGVMITAGPGSFTGLRIAVTVAKMMFLAHKVKIITADSTDVIAENASDFIRDSQQEVNCVCTILDAKKNLFYTSVFKRQSDGWAKILGTRLLSAEDILSWLRDQGQKKVYFLGEGLVYYAKIFKSDISLIMDEQYWAPTAAGLFRCGQRLAQKGQFADPHTLAPLYIRRPEAVENWERRQQGSSL